MLSSELYAVSQNTVCSGPEFCYWCSSPCNREYQHGDAPPIPFQKRHSLARKPSEPWICAGCYLWRQPSVTARFLLPADDKATRPFKDRQCPVNHSWLVTEQAAWAIIFESHAELYRRLLAPPKLFLLSLLSDKSIPNHLQLCQVNEHAEVAADTPLAFTIDNIPHTYTVYELEEAIRNGPAGKEPGVQALCRLLGPFTLPSKPVAEKTSGRPKADSVVDGKVTKRKVS